MYLNPEYLRSQLVRKTTELYIMRSIDFSSFFVIITQVVRDTLEK